MKKCPTCRAEVIGREDKIYCNDNCRTRKNARRFLGLPESDNTMNNKVQRDKETLKAKHAVMYILSQHFKLEQVGKILNCHHTSVIHGRNKVSDNYKDYSEIIKLITSEPNQVEMCNKFLLRRKA